MRAASKYAVANFYGMDNFIDYEWEDYSNHFGEGVEISRNWGTTHVLVFDGLEIVMVSVGVSFSLLMCYNEHIVRLKF